MNETAESTKPASQWLRSNLVTLGSAAVFTVYSAGYFRTREAAQRFAGESVQRRAAAAISPSTNHVDAVPNAAAPDQHSGASSVIHPSSSANPGFSERVASVKASSAPSTGPRSPAPGTPAATTAPAARRLYCSVATIAAPPSARCSTLGARVSTSTSTRASACTRPGSKRGECDRAR